MSFFFSSFALLYWKIMPQLFQTVRALVLASIALLFCSCLPEDIMH